MSWLFKDPVVVMKEIMSWLFKDTINSGQAKKIKLPQMSFFLEKH